MAGQDITVGMTIGDSLTGTLRASTDIPAPNDGNNITLIDAIASAASLADYNTAHSVSLTALPVVNEPIVSTQLQAFGITATLVAAGSVAASVDVTLTHAKGAGTTSPADDITFTLKPTAGQPNGVAFASAAAAGITHNIASITVTPDAHGAVVEIQGKIYTTVV